MTEIDVKPGDESSSKEIVRQVEYYFGDFNLPKDKFLLDKVKSSDGGWIDIDIMLKFQRLAKISSSDGDSVIKALKDSSKLMEVDEEAKKIRRNPEEPIPEYDDDRKKALKEMTVYVKGFDKETKEIDGILGFFEDSCPGDVLNVFMRQWFNKKEGTKGFKGSVFLTFKTKEAAASFMEKEDELKYKDQILLKKWQEQYFKDKTEEIEERRKNRGSKKKADDKNGKPESNAETIVKEEAPPSLPKGAVLVLNSLNESTSREDLKDKLKERFEVDPDDIAFIYYQRGDKTAHLRFKVENSAVKLLEKLKTAEGGLEINEAVVEYKVLEGEEEEVFLKKCIDDMASRKSKSKGHKRRGGNFSGGGGKKRRR